MCSLASPNVQSFTAAALANWNDTAHVRARASVSLVLIISDRPVFCDCKGLAINRSHGLLWRWDADDRVR